MKWGAFPLLHLQIQHKRGTVFDTVPLAILGILYLRLNISYFNNLFSLLQSNYEEPMAHTYNRRHDLLLYQNHLEMN